MVHIQFAAAVLLLFMGHFCKMLRWKQSTEVYEDVGRRLLTRSLAYGYLVNYFVPCRIGDLVRAIFAGRRMENGIAFSLATVLLDRCMDVWVVGVLFIFMVLTGSFSMDMRYTVALYIISAFGSILLLVLLTRQSGPVKRAAKKVCSIFNERIELALLAFLWAGITSIKDMVKRMDKVRLIGLTVLMWFFYLTSYNMMSLSLRGNHLFLSFFDIFSLLFASGQLNWSTFSVAQLSGAQTTLKLAIYILLPLLMLMLLSFLPARFLQGFGKVGADAPPRLHLLPQVNPKDRLTFLENYFEANNREYLEQYININRNVLILSDYSAGSNATTILCMDEQGTFYRKYAFGRDAGKLHEQIAWLEAYAGCVPLPEILRAQIGTGCCCYDMAYHPDATGLFQYLHSAETAVCWDVLNKALTDLDKEVHQRNRRPADLGLLEQYIDKKIYCNLEKIENSNELSVLAAYESLVINGRTYCGLPQLKHWLDRQCLIQLFREDFCADIHGDLTVENIICRNTAEGADYYFIDPNTGNLHESPFLDYAKLLQSLHGGYEFLMRTKKVTVSKNRIDFLFLLSHNYNEIFQRYKQFLERRFTASQLRSIYFHEIVHWLRLMPYKIEKDSKRAPMFFAGLIMVFNDIVDWIGEGNNEKTPVDL